LLSGANEIEQVVANAGDMWDNHPYYDKAEGAMDFQWETKIFPMINGCKMDVSVDLAAGHGRNSVKLLDHCKQHYIVDIHQSNLDYCAERFSDLDNVEYILTNGYSLTGILDNSVDLLYSFDAVVHFDSDVIRRYLEEAHRILKPGGHFFCHHSNSTENPTEGDITNNTHFRNFMSAELYSHYAWKSSLKTVRQQVIGWGKIPEIDCMTLVQKAGS